MWIQRGKKSSNWNYSPSNPTPWILKCLIRVLSAVSCAWFENISRTFSNSAGFGFGRENETVSSTLILFVKSFFEPGSKVWDISIFVQDPVGGKASFSAWSLPSTIGIITHISPPLVFWGNNKEEIISSNSSSPWSSPLGFSLLFARIPRLWLLSEASFCSRQFVFLSWKSATEWNISPDILF